MAGTFLSGTAHGLLVIQPGAGIDPDPEYGFFSALQLQLYPGNLRRGRPGVVKGKEIPGENY